MKPHGVFLALMLAISCSASKLVIECTPNCQCDLYNNYRRAICNDDKMIHVMGNVPKYTEILEFTNNYVSEIKMEEFYRNGLSTLKFANLSHNKIMDIHIYAFEKMNELKSLDLSYNALRYVLPEWFWSLESLEELFLNNNYLSTLSDKPLFECYSLKILSLANCEIPHIYPSTFTQLTSLEELDISSNQLIELSAETIDSLQNLTQLKLASNKLICNDVGTDFISYVKESGIVIDDNFCLPKKMKEIKFERMIIKPKKISSKWLINRKEVNVLEESDEEDCVCNATISGHLAVLENFTWIAIELIIIGIISGIFISYCCFRLGKCCDDIFMHHKTQRFIKRNERLLDDIEDIVESTPMTVRKFPR